MFEYFSRFLGWALGLDDRFSFEFLTTDPAGLTEGFELDTNDLYLF
jgi:hypothetical protein